MKLAQARAVIESSAYKMTRARARILDGLLKIKSPFTAFDLEKVSGVDLATVYRNLPVFEELGLICKGDFADDVARYMVADPGHDHHHHHIVCRSCDRIEAVDFCILQAQEQILSKLGFREIRHRLEFSGLCRRCS